MIHDEEIKEWKQIKQQKENKKGIFLESKTTKNHQEVMNLKLNCDASQTSESHQDKDYFFADICTFALSFDLEDWNQEDKDLSFRYQISLKSILDSHELSSLAFSKMQ